MLNKFLYLLYQILQNFLLIQKLKGDDAFLHYMDNMIFRKAFVFVAAMAAGLILSKYFFFFGHSPIGVGLTAGLICMITNTILISILRIR